MPATPLPPRALRERTGRAPAGHDEAAFYEEQGRQQRRRIEALLGDDWSWKGRRLLDFGCGAGRTLRHFLAVAQAGETEVWGCDIDRRSIEWLRAHLVPPLEVLGVGETPGLPHPDDYFDVIWGLSFFTHVHDQWAEWLLELRRVLADDGRLLLTFLSEGKLGLWNELTGNAPWDPEGIGMAVFCEDASWNDGGPIVFLSEWWVREHWGRAFSIERISTGGFGPGGQGYALLRKRRGSFSPEDLRRPHPREPGDDLATALERDRLRRELAAVYSSRSWRLTSPLREVAHRLRRR